MDLNRRLKELEAEIHLLKQTVDARNCELEVLHELSGKLGQSLDGNHFFTTLFSNLAKCISVDLAIGLLGSPSDDSPQLFVQGQKRFGILAQEELLEKMCTGLEMMGGSTVDPAALTDGFNQANLKSSSNVPVETIGSFFQVPIISAGDIVGVIALADQEPDHFYEEQIRLVYTVANQAAMAVEGINALFDRERHRLQTIVDNLPDGIVLLDADHVPITANTTATQLLNTQPKPSKDSNQGAFTGVKLQSLEERHFEQAAESGHSVVEEDIVVGDAEQRRLEPHLIALGDNQSSEKWMVVLRDVTESRLAVRRRDDFLAMLAHELRNPLSPILNAVQIIGMSHADQTIRDDALTIVERQAKHMAGIVDDLLEVSRFLHGKIVLKRTECRLNELLGEVTPAFDSQAKKCGLKLVVGSSDVPLVAKLDVKRITQVISNLLANAIKYSTAGGTVTVDVREDAGDALLIVTDTGIGLDGVEQKSIFEPFMQVQSNLARSEGGLGLGLALVKMIVQQHEGSISAESDGKGEGSRFTVRLPLCQETTRQESNPAVKDHIHKGVEILLVEDKRDAREMQKQLLELYGYSVITAADGEEGVAQFKRHRPGICLIDIGLPKMNGFEVASAIRELAGDAPALIALTGYSQQDMKESFEAKGFDRHIIKPINVDRLQEILDECMSNQSLGHERPASKM